jgi:hypothetical protein
MISKTIKIALFIALIMSIAVSMTFLSMADVEKPISKKDFVDKTILVGHEWGGFINYNIDSEHENTGAPILDEDTGILVGHEWGGFIYYDVDSD